MKLIPLLLLLCAGCASTERDPAENCADFITMGRGVVACEQAGDRCAYSETEHAPELTSLDAPDVSYVCTCGDDIRHYWCQSVCAIGGVRGLVTWANENPGRCSQMAETRGDSKRSWCCL